MSPAGISQAFLAVLAIAPIRGCWESGGSTPSAPQGLPVAPAPPGAKADPFADYQPAESSKRLPPIREVTELPSPMPFGLTQCRGRLHAKFPDAAAARQAWDAARADVRKAEEVVDRFSSVKVRCVPPPPPGLEAAYEQCWRRLLADLERKQLIAEACALEVQAKAVEAQVETVLKSR